MDIEHVNQIEGLCDKVSDLIHKLDDEKQFDDLKSALGNASKHIDDGSVLTVSIRVTYDFPEKDIQIPYYDMGFTCPKNETPYLFEGSSTLATYVMADGNVYRIPHDRCPSCWELWDFKLHNGECSNCGAKLGSEVKQMLDSDICPYCEKGKVTIRDPKCKECGQEIDPDKIVWG
jgi:hypothetical protein